MKRFAFDPNSKNIAVVIFIITLFGYLVPLIPEIHKIKFLMLGLILSGAVVATPKMKDIATRYLLKEKNIRYLSYHKIVEIDEHGNGNIVANIELLNEGESAIQRYSHRVWTTIVNINKSLETLADEGSFEIKSLDGHSLTWESVEDNSKNKKVYIIFDSLLQPGDSRKFSIRLKLDGLYKTKKSDLPEGILESSSFSPLYICDLYKIKIKFRPHYEFTNLRYCVKTPCNEELQNKCKDIQDSRDTETTGRFVELEVANPWRNFEYRIEWAPNN
jgi:hypothetical protein